MFKKYSLLFVCAVVLFAFHANAQKDTIRIMQYNLLRYGEGGEEPATKNPWLKTIVNYVNPDIFGTNEISGSASYPQNILVNVLNTDGKTYWKKSNYSNTASDKSLVNTLFYNSDKFELIDQKVIGAITREIIAFRLYYKAADLATTQDTVFFTIIIAHLKAGNGTPEASTRNLETQKVVTYLNKQQKPGNVIFMGDFNVYTSSELAYQNVTANTNYFGQLFDPLNRPGGWNNNSSYKDIHTQSTRSADGGIDDRFDFMLCSRYLLNDSLRMKILPETYIPVGNDGLHFNKGINDAPQNTSVPADVLSALFNFSDHMPIRADYVITTTSSTGIKKSFLDNEIKVVNPFSDPVQLFFSEQLINQKLSIQLFSFDGRLVAEETTMVDAGLQHQVRVPSGSTGGLYVLRITNEKGESVSKKLVRF